MIRITSTEHVLSTMWALSRPYINVASAELNDAALRYGLRQFYRAVQPGVPRAGHADPPRVVTDPQALEVLEAVFGGESRLDDTLYRLRGIEVDPVLAERVSDALQSLTDAFPEHRALFDVAFSDLFFGYSDEAEGGTTSDALGVLWLNPKESWTQRDFQEFYIHELTHTLIFLDEWRFGLYHDIASLADPSSWTLSAIRTTRRPLDKTLHSIIVATEVLLTREEASSPERSRLHPNSRELRDSILRSVASVRETRRACSMLTPHGIHLLERCESAARDRVTVSAIAG